MPVDLGATDVIEVVFEGKLDLQQTISTFFYKVSSLGGANPMFDELDAMITRLRAPNKLFQKYQNVTSDQLKDLQVYVQVVYPIRYRYTNGGELTQTGGVDNFAFPANVQASITRAAERAGRRYVSHLAVPAVPGSSIENSQLTAAYLTDLQALADEMKQTIILPSGTELTPVIFNRNNDPVSQVIRFTFPQPTSRVIRRRTVGLGK